MTYVVTICKKIIKGVHLGFENPSFLALSRKRSRPQPAMRIRTAPLFETYATAHLPYFGHCSRAGCKIPGCPMAQVNCSQSCTLPMASYAKR